MGVSRNIGKSICNQGEFFRMNICRILKEGEGRKVHWITREAYMLDIGLFGEEDYCIHIDTEFEVIWNGELYTGTFDMDDGKDSFFDQKIRRLMSGRELYLNSISVNEDYMLYLEFDNSLVIHTNYCPDLRSDDEIWRIFYHWSTKDALIAYPTEIEVEKCPFTEEELRDLKSKMDDRKGKT